MSRQSSKPGRFFALSAPSGAGKTTLVSRLLKDFPDIGVSISHTTRRPRHGEKNGVDYFFVDDKTFQEMIKNGLFFEWEEVHGAFYGTPKGFLDKRRSSGKYTLLDVDVRGALSLKKAYPDTCSIFILPPSLEVLEARLRSRRTESEEALQRRLEDARREMEAKDQFDHTVINDDIDRAYDDIRKIISKEIK